MYIILNLILFSTFLWNAVSKWQPTTWNFRKCTECPVFVIIAINLITMSNNSSMNLSKLTNNMSQMPIFKYFNPRKTSNDVRVMQSAAPPSLHYFWPSKPLLPLSRMMGTKTTTYPTLISLCGEVSTAVLWTKNVFYSPCITIRVVIKYHVIM